MGKLWTILTHLHSLAGYVTYDVQSIHLHAASVFFFSLSPLLHLFWFCPASVFSPLSVQFRSVMLRTENRLLLFVPFLQANGDAAVPSVRVRAGDGEPVQAGRRAVARLLDPLLLRHAHGDAPRVPHILVITTFTHCLILFFIRL